MSNPAEWKNDNFPGKVGLKFREVHYIEVETPFDRWPGRHRLQYGGRVLAIAVSEQPRQATPDGRGTCDDGNRSDSIRATGGAMAYFVSWIRDGRISRFAHPHSGLSAALDFACEAFRIECSDVWITDDNGQKVADRKIVAEHADRVGKSYC